MSNYDPMGRRAAHGIEILLGFRANELVNEQNDTRTVR